MSLISRIPLRFTPEQWLSRAQIGDEYASLLPKTSLDARAIAEPEEWFGPKGGFPAVTIIDERSERHA
jgi:hypothetical protein